MGTRKLPTESEKKNIVIARRSIHIMNGLLKDHVITEKI
jgi:hypothetical protein